MEALHASFADDLHRIHRALTRGMSVAAKRAREFARKGFPDGETRRGFLDFVRCLVIATCAHQDAEDDVGFPAFRERLAEVPFSELDSQHEVFHSTVDSVQAGLSAAAEGKTDALWLPELADSLSRLSYIWSEHISVEEGHLTTQALDRAFSPDEQAELKKRMVEHSRIRSEPVSQVLPFLYFNLSVEDRESFAAGIPEEVTRRLIPVEWKDAWAGMKPFLLP
jgi:hypothetical protein